MNLFKKIFLLSLMLTVTSALAFAEGQQERTLQSGSSNSSGINATAEEGGPGFTGEGWLTNDNPFQYGDPKNAVKGGSLTHDLSDYPDTFRKYGPSSSTGFIQRINDLMFEPLLDFDMQDQTYSPRLATHWKRNEDDSELYFRLNTDARWSDGKPVVADDIVATFNLLKDETLNDPNWFDTFKDFTAVKVTDYIVKITNSAPNWRDFWYIAFRAKIYPAHHLTKVDGAGFIEKYNKQFTPNSGPYTFDIDKTIDGDLFVLKRRTDFWGKDLKLLQGVYNFDYINYLIIRDENLKKEKFKKGDTDFYLNLRSSWWAQEFNLENPEPAFDPLTRGLVQKRKVYNYYPKGRGGLVLNMRKPPFDDIRMRKVAALLFNVDLLNKTMFFNEYTRLNSIYPKSIYENPNNPKYEFDPKTANALLDEMGWTGRNSEGYRTKNGEALTINMSLTDRSVRVMTPLQEDMKKAGINLVMDVVDWNSLINRLDERRFDVIYGVAFGGLDFPNPSTSYKSSLADQPQSDNYCGFKNEEVDRLIEQYDAAKDARERITILQKIDNIVVNTIPIALGWGSAHTDRILFWNKFSMPEWYYSFNGSYRTYGDVSRFWWFDSEKADRLEEAMNDSSIKLDYGPQTIDYWNILGN